MRALLAAALMTSGLAWTPSNGAAQETIPPAQTAGRANHAQLYGGFTTNGSTEFTAGAKFSRHEGDRGLALAGFTEVIFADDTQFLLGALLQYHMRGRLVLEAGPGVAFNGGSDFFLRLGAGWAFRPVGLTIEPRVTLDFIHGGTRLGYGVALGRRF